MLAKLVGILFVLLLVAGVPALSYLTARQTQIRLIPRPALYFSAVLSQCILAALGTAVVFSTSASLSGLGFRTVCASAFLRWTLLLTLVTFAGLGVMLVLERRGWWPAESELVVLLLPETRLEKLAAVLVLAPTAAFCEEFLYRGYLLAQLSEWFQSLPWAWGVSSVAFGLAHTYQGPSGMLRAALLGALLTFPVVRLGSLYPSMAAHFLIDALSLAWLGPRLLGRRPKSDWDSARA